MMNALIAHTFLDQWKSGATHFALTTSGSTGEPKTIDLRREIMQWSASNTASVIHPTKNDRILCCIPCTKIGGLMMLVRALEWKIPIEVVIPSSNPFLEDQNASIVSVTPFQLHHILNNPVSLTNLKKIRAVIIGGGEISKGLEQMIQDGNFKDTIFYHSYGMTETYSHIALRTINGAGASDYFKPFSDVSITTDEEGCGIIQLPFETDALHTTDILKFYEDNQFDVIGRKDFIINTGGVKIQPEVIEKVIVERLNPKNAFIISSEKDEILGDKLVLVAEKEFEYGTDDLQFLKAINPYAVPKAIHIVDAFQRNEGGKIKRK